MAGVGESIAAGVAGGVSFYAHKLAGENVDVVRNNFWVGPAVLLLAGHMLKRKPKMRGVGLALQGAAGYGLAQGFVVSQSIQKDTSALIGHGGASSVQSTSVPMLQAPAPVDAGPGPEPEHIEAPEPRGDASDAAYLGLPRF